MRWASVLWWAAGVYQAALGCMGVSFIHCKELLANSCRDALLVWSVSLLPVVDW